METLSQTSRISSRHLQYRYYLAGGGSMFEDWTKEFLKKQTYLFAEDPLRAVVRGTGMALKKPSKFKSILIK
jgi:actin-like ATPase involved in cell morphogenesis